MGSQGGGPGYENPRLSKIDLLKHVLECSVQNISYQNLWDAAEPDVSEFMLL